MERLLRLCERRDLGVYARFAHTTCDELGDLAAEVDDENGIGKMFCLHGHPVKASMPYLSSDSQASGERCREIIRKGTTIARPGAVFCA